MQAHTEAIHGILQDHNIMMWTGGSLDILTVAKDPLHGGLNSRSMGINGIVQEPRRNMVQDITKNMVVLAEEEREEYTTDPIDTLVFIAQLVYLHI